MSSPIAMPPIPRSQVHERIDQLSDSDLATVGRLLTQIEAERLLDTVSDAMDDARKAGKLDDATASLRAFHERRPYR